MKQLFRALFHWLEGKDPNNLPPESVNELDMEWIEGTRRRLVEKRFRTQPPPTEEVVENAGPESIEMIPQLMRGGLRQSLSGVGHEVTRSQRARWFEAGSTDEDNWTSRVEASLLSSESERRLRQHKDEDISYSPDYARQWINRMQNSGEQQAIELPSYSDYSVVSESIESAPNIYDHLVESENKWQIGLPQYQFGGPVRPETGEEPVAQEEESSWCDGLFETREEFCAEVEMSCGDVAQSDMDESELDSNDNDDINQAIDEELNLAHIEQNRARIEQELEELLKVDVLEAPGALAPCLAFASSSPESRRARPDRGLLKVSEAVFTGSALPVDVSECLMVVPDIHSMSEAVSESVNGSNAKKVNKKSGKKKSRGGSGRSSSGR